MMNADNLQELLMNLKDEHGFLSLSWTSLSRPISIDVYKSWVSDNKHGEMTYLKTHSDIKESPQLKWPLMRSAIVATAPYRPHPHPVNLKTKYLRISQYAQGEDYHHWFQAKLEKVANSLKQHFPLLEFYCATDSSPILERDLAVRANSGWVGKNSCVIQREHGSLFFIGEVLINLELQPTSFLEQDFCGKCRRCIEVCPTGAIEESRTLDATKCISYWTIESRKTPPLEIRSKIGDHFFGCDICQNVCPWNQKIHGPLETSLLRSNSNIEASELTSELCYVLLSSGKQLERDFRGTALSRAGSFGLKRNALIVIGNLKLKGCKTAVETFVSHPKLGELAQWTLEELKS